jgi:hypothetical protein
MTIAMLTLIVHKSLVCLDFKNKYMKAAVRYPIREGVIR